MSMKTEISNLITEYHEASAALKEKVRQTFGDVTKEFFDENPEVHSIHWTQYTDHFNDGDPCHFHVNEINFFSTLAAEEHEVDSAGTYNANHFYKSDWYDDETDEAYDKLVDKHGLDRVTQVYKNTEEMERIINGIPDDVMRSMFDDGVHVVITREGVTINEFEHD